MKLLYALRAEANERTVIVSDITSIVIEDGELSLDKGAVREIAHLLGSPTFTIRGRAHPGEITDSNPEYSMTIDAMQASA